MEKTKSLLSRRAKQGRWHRGVVGGHAHRRGDHESGADTCRWTRQANSAQSTSREWGWPEGIKESIVRGRTARILNGAARDALPGHCPGRLGRRSAHCPILWGGREKASLPAQVRQHKKDASLYKIAQSDTKLRIRLLSKYYIQSRHPE